MQSEFSSKKKLSVTSILLNKNVLFTIALTLFILIIYHVLSVITLPCVTLKKGFSADSLTSMLNLLAGGGLSKLSIFAVGLGPYITAQIIVQLLSTDLVPVLSNWNKSGEVGKKKIEVLNRILTLPFAIAQGFAIIALLLKSGNGDITIFGKEKIGDLSFSQLTIIITIFTAGTYIGLFFGDMITKRGVGNGVTLLILAGIVASIFADFSAAFSTINSKLVANSKTYLLSFILSIGIYVLLFIVLLMVVIFINDSVRKIPIQQTGQGLIEDNNKLPFLPIKLNSAGVIPVIFASSLMTIPSTISQFLSSSSSVQWFINDYLVVEKPVGLCLYAFFIIVFSFFYSYIQINPKNLTENFEKSGKFIPGVRSGEDTKNYIIKVLYRINWIGAPFLAFVASLPYIIYFITGIPSGLALGGTGIIIIVTGATEVWNSIKSNATTSNYNVAKTKIEEKLYEQNITNNENKSLWK